MSLLPFDILSCIMDYADKETLLLWSLVDSGSSRLARVLLALRRAIEVDASFSGLSSFLLKLDDREGTLSSLASSSTSLSPFSSLLRSLTLNLPFPALSHLPLPTQDSPIPIQSLTLGLPSANFRLSSFQIPLLSLFSPRQVIFVPPAGGQWIFHFKVEAKVQQLLESWKEVKEWRFQDCNALFEEDGFCDRDASSRVRNQGGMRRRSEMVYDLTGTTMSHSESFFAGFAGEREEEGVKGGRIIVGNDEKRGWVGEREGWVVEVSKSS